MTQDLDDTNHSSPASTQRARRASAVDAGGAHQDTLPEAEVVVKTSRRRFSPSYKLRILEQADACSQSGEVGALLRREGLYSSHLSKWRLQREQGVLAGLTPRKRGRKAKPRSAGSVRIAQLERDVQRLQGKLEQAELIIDVQKKVSRLLGISMPTTPEKSENDS